MTGTQSRISPMLPKHPNSAGAPEFSWCKAANPRDANRAVLLWPAGLWSVLVSHAKKPGVVGVFISQDQKSVVLLVLKRWAYIRISHHCWIQRIVEREKRKAIPGCYCKLLCIKFEQSNKRDGGAGWGPASWSGRYPTAVCIILTCCQKDKSWALARSLKIS